MVGVWVYADFDRGARGYAKGARGTGLELVAADVGAGDVADEAVVLPVLGLADVDPGTVAVDGGESVCEGLLDGVCVWCKKERCREKERKQTVSTSQRSTSSEK